MLLAFGPGVGDQGADIESFGSPEDGTGDVNRIVKGELVNNLGRRVVDPGKSPCELDPGCYFDFLLQPAYHLAEHPDFVVGVPPGYQQIGRIPQRSLAAFGRAPRNRDIQFLQK
jgi:hypothetical protein